MCRSIRLSVIVVALLFVVSKMEGKAIAAEEGAADKAAADKAAAEEKAAAGNSEQSTAPAEPATTPDEQAQVSSESKSEAVNPDGLQVAELVVAKGIEARKPLDPKDSYKLGEYDRIVAYMLIANPTETANEVFVSFLHTDSGKERGKVSVSVGAQKKWRTWAFSRMVNKAGKWEVIVRDKDENVIGRTLFEIVE